MKLSVALVTRNRPIALERCLISLRHQGVQPFEVLVSDDSDPDTASETRNLAAIYDCSYLEGPRRGLYANRNFVAVHCSGSHIRTMDDDHVLPPGHFETCFSAIDADPVAIWTTGETVYLDGLAPAIYETGIQLGPSGVGEQILSLDDNWGIADGSTIYPRAIFDRGFRMVEEFGFGASYLEFGAFLYKKGWRCRCIRGALIEHRLTAFSQPDPASIAFASICFNAYFQPNPYRLVRGLIPCWRQSALLPSLFQIAKKRWT